MQSSNVMSMEPNTGLCCVPVIAEYNSIYSIQHASKAAQLIVYAQTVNYASMNAHKCHI